VDRAFKLRFLWTPEYGRYVKYPYGICNGSCFVDGKVSNVEPDVVALWVDRVAALGPRAVHIYAIDEAPREAGVTPAETSRLEDIAQIVAEATGIPVFVTPA
jgi:hypothetical protein